MNKKLLVYLTTAVVAATLSLQVYGAAADPATGVTTTPTADTGVVQKQAGITPDSVFYPIEKLIESVQVSLTFYSESKAELLVSFANERLAEAEVMTEKNKMDLVEKVLKVYTKTVQSANRNLEQAAEDNKDIAATLEEIKITQDDADRIVIKVTGVIPQSVEEELKTTMVSEVKRTLAIKSFATVKESFKEAKEQVELAQEELKQAEKTGDETKITAAKDKLAQAKEYKAQMEKAKEEIEQYKEEIKKVLEDENEDKAEDDPKSVMESDKVLDKVEKIEKQIEKFEEKRQEVVGRVEGHSEKAAQKIEENTKKQIEKKKEKVEKFAKRAEEKSNKNQ